MWCKPPALVYGALCSLRTQQEVHLRVRSVPVYCISENNKFGYQFSVLVDGHPQLIELAQSLKFPERFPAFVPSFIDPAKLDGRTPLWDGASRTPGIGKIQTALHIDFGYGKLFDESNKLVPFSELRKGQKVSMQLSATAKFSPFPTKLVAGSGTSDDSGDEEPAEANKENQLRSSWVFRVWQMKIVERPVEGDRPSDTMTCGL